MDEKQDAAAVAALIVIGRDEAGRPHGSRFGEADVALAEKAAGLMKMVAVRVADEPFGELAGRLPQGRVVASGKAVVPFLKDKLSREIEDQLTPEVQAELDRPRRVEDATSGGDVDSGGRAEDAAASYRLPAKWNDIAVEDLVLATLGSPDGWFECIVTIDHGEDLFTLRYRDFPDWDPFVRRREHLALVHPGFTFAPMAA